jgi:hypothetical protein
MKEEKRKKFTSIEELMKGLFPITFEVSRNASVTRASGILSSRQLAISINNFD